MGKLIDARSEKRNYQIEGAFSNKENRINEVTRLQLITEAESTRDSSSALAKSKSPDKKSEANFSSLYFLKKEAGVNTKIRKKSDTVSSIKQPTPKAQVANINLVTRGIIGGKPAKSFGNSMIELNNERRLLSPASRRAYENLKKVAAAMRQNMASRAKATPEQPQRELNSKNTSSIEKAPSKISSPAPVDKKAEIPSVTFNVFKENGCPTEQTKSDSGFKTTQSHAKHIAIAAEIKSPFEQSASPKVSEETKQQQKNANEIKIVCRRLRNQIQISSSDDNKQVPNLKTVIQDLKDYMTNLNNLVQKH